MAESRDAFVVLDDGEFFGVYFSESWAQSIVDHDESHRVVVPAALTYELPKPEPKFKVGDRLRNKESNAIPVISRYDDRMDMYYSELWSQGYPREFIEDRYELAPAEPKFQVGEMVLDRAEHEFVKVTSVHAGKPEPYVVAGGDGHRSWRSEYQLAKIA